MNEIKETKNMRERTRRIIRTELTEIAQDLFIKNGYEATTVDQIASAAGMSKRTFFRYFASKEDLVIGKYDLFEEMMVEAFNARPLDEGLWDSLRKVLDVGVNYFSNPVYRKRAEEMDRIVHSNPSLHARFLERVARLQFNLSEIAQKRGNFEPGSPKTRAIVGAAFACFTAAQESWYKSNNAGNLADLLDEAMTPFRIQTATTDNIQAN